MVFFSRDFRFARVWKANPSLRCFLDLYNHIQFGCQPAACLEKNGCTKKPCGGNVFPNVWGMLTARIKWESLSPWCVRITLLWSIEDVWNASCHEDLPGTQNNQLSINRLCFTPIVHGFFQYLGSLFNIICLKKLNISLFHGCSRRPFFGRRWPLCPKLFLFSGHSSIVESSSSHAMILLQQQQMKFKQHGHVSRSGHSTRWKLGWG